MLPPTLFWKGMDWIGRSVWRDLTKDELICKKIVVVISSVVLRKTLLMNDKEWCKTLLLGLFCRQEVMAKDSDSRMV
jgi:hypothetical protein